MTKTQTLSLGQYWNHFIEDALKIGRYSSASEVVRNALRLLEEKEANSKLEMLRSALMEGEESGDAGKLDMKEIKKSAKSKIK
ncbi:type II toxin-antitoxin system ParD family antitoxin [Rickettsiales bacterium]|nr:type II toxin-antitoxin system ParD family antitoxin [Rickettsiales bacterium]MDB2550429.1 type II toxin-antitoxin system ParD family antitoxin [Rickettsiales bacterium]